jgi:hypothetical protein
MRWHVYRFWKKKLTLRALLAIIVLNIVVSLLILHQRGGSNIILKIYYHNTHTPLLVTLDAYRTRYLSITDANTNEIKLITEKIHHKPIIDNTAFDWLRDEKYSHADPPPTTDQFNDNIFSSKSFLKDIVQPRSILKKSFYEPKVLINNADACSSRKNKIFIVCMIHSHRNKYLFNKKFI